MIDESVFIGLTGCLIVFCHVREVSWDSLLVCETEVASWWQRWSSVSRLAVSICRIWCWVVKTLWACIRWCVSDDLAYNKAASKLDIKDLFCLGFHCVVHKCAFAPSAIENVPIARDVEAVLHELHAFFSKATPKTAAVQDLVGAIWWSRCENSGANQRLLVVNVRVMGEFYAHWIPWWGPSKRRQGAIIVLLQISSGSQPEIVVGCPIPLWNDQEFSHSVKTL